MTVQKTAEVVAPTERISGKVSTRIITLWFVSDSAQESAQLEQMRRWDMNSRLTNYQINQKIVT